MLVWFEARLSTLCPTGRLYTGPFHYTPSSDNCHFLTSAEANLVRTRPLASDCLLTKGLVCSPHLHLILLTNFMNWILCVIIIFSVRTILLVEFISHRILYLIMIMLIDYIIGNWIYRIAKIVFQHFFSLFYRC